MPARFNLYSAWIDPKFYGWAAVFAAALFLFVWSLRRWLALRSPAAEEPGPEPAAAAPDAEAEQNPFLEDPAPPAAAAPAEEKTLVLAPGEQQAFLSAASAAQPEQPPATEPEPAAPEAAPEAPPAAEPQALQEAPAPAPEEPAPAPAAAEGHNAAENFVRGIYAGISDLDERMKTIEAALSKGHVNNDFTVKFLEDVLQDIDSLDKAKIKARLEYLLSDLKK